jgi:hypothetical protein
VREFERENRIVGREGIIETPFMQGGAMFPIRVVAIPTEVAEAVRTTSRDPHYGFPAHTAAIKEAAPCRHCLHRIAAGEKATLFTYDAFAGQENLPLPGPVYVHAGSCRRYPEAAGYPLGFTFRIERG